ncbi:MAG: transcriptional repressor [Bacteroidetes bacterium]|nr:MAG: transcriptional repressor [Bacteroidota bacterium]
MKISINNTEQHLREHKIMPSVQRIRIFDTLLGTTEHPTVDTIYQSLAKEIPTLSKTTVYNTLKLFQEKGLVIVVNIEDNETRYDADTSFHGHFKCQSCGSVIDFAISKEDRKINSLKGFQVDESHFYLKGICKKCINKQSINN